MSTAQSPALQIMLTNSFVTELFTAIDCDLALQLESDI
jgi:hypothetical protein